MTIRYVLLFSFCLFLAMFYGFSWQVKQGRFTRINFDTTVRLQDNIPSRFNSLFEDAAILASPAASVILVIGLTCLSFFDFKRKKLRWRSLIIPIAFVGLVGVEIYGKMKVESPAPPYFMIKNPTTIFPKYHVQEQYSYPSGHAARSLFLAGIASLILLLYVGKPSIPAILTYSLFIFFSFIISIGKIYLGRHWLSDIIGGWILAIAFLSLCFECIINIKDAKNNS